ncbi:MAG: sugar phosphate nucleotidyltransferase [Methanoculleus sp.]|nr:MULTISPECIES: bifunctional sugar-1-phosphate nucleotidylyltransferase/acetyltransferase [unclassified Methanoculleus]MCK9318051.1 sugar phosphate nucleotidyltransferase [Methanoculleus sp.]MDD2253217.1 sugar phosphate nucleotidyltransferase [Methanoculleus sp.]MDD2786580.1 sugar phosphate nucleotidyltransferase [Methanoculleus sp.]MDD3215545.1 sugar phosphate nucleotidyltransferase [Methanoculleus sp.]MDD4313181.1 sugar phosphate nucleotidyltransferase [Methanoculleus sp.]
MQAVILAAGEGSRLRPLTRSKPKAMLPVANRPIIEYVIDALLENGIRDIVVVVGYRKEDVIRHLNRLDAPIQVAVQERQLGTADALRAAQTEITDDFLVLPGDNYINAESIARIKRERNAMLVAEHPNPSNFGVVVIRNGLVREIIEKPEDAPTFTVSTGIYSFTPDVFSYLHTTEIPDALAAMIATGKRIRAIPADDWQDAIYPWDLLKLNSRMLRGITPEIGGMVDASVIRRGTVHIGAGTTVGPNTVIYGPVTIGNNCNIGPNCVIMPDVSIGDRVVLEPFTYVADSLIMGDVKIGSHSRIVSAVFGQGCILADHTTTYPSASFIEVGGRVQKEEFGAVLGEGVRAAPFTTFKNCIAGNNVIIEEGKTVSGLIEDATRVM